MHAPGPLLLPAMGGCGVCSGLLVLVEASRRVARAAAAAQACMAAVRHTLPGGAGCARDPAAVFPSPHHTGPRAGGEVRDVCSRKAMALPKILVAGSVSRGRRRGRWHTSGLWAWARRGWCKGEGGGEGRGEGPTTYARAERTPVAASSDCGSSGSSPVLRRLSAFLGAECTAMAGAGSCRRPARLELLRVAGLPNSVSQTDGTHTCRCCRQLGHPHTAWPRLSSGGGSRCPRERLVPDVFDRACRRGLSARARTGCAASPFMPTPTPTHDQSSPHTACPAPPTGSQVCTSAPSHTAHPIPPPSSPSCGRECKESRPVRAPWRLPTPTTRVGRVRRSPALHGRALRPSPALQPSRCTHSRSCASLLSRCRCCRCCCHGSICCHCNVSQRDWQTRRPSPPPPNFTTSLTSLPSNLLDLALPVCICTATGRMPAHHLTFCVHISLFPPHKLNPPESKKRKHDDTEADDAASSDNDTSQAKRSVLCWQGRLHLPTKPSSLSKSHSLQQRPHRRRGGGCCCPVADSTAPPGVSPHNSFTFCLP